MANKIVLPIHARTRLLAVGIVRGRPVWPILGGDDTADAAAQAAAKATADAAKVAADQAAADAAAKAAADAAANEKGYPENTPVSEMTPDQRNAYDRHMRDQNRAKAQEWKSITGDMTPEQFRAHMQDLQAKAARQDALERELMSDKDKAVAEATDTAKAAARAELLPDLVHAKFEAAAAGRLTGEQISAILAPLDLKFFLDTSGKVDTAKVNTYVEQVAPAKGTNGTQPPRLGPSSSGQGNRGNSTTGASVASGRDLYLSKHPAKPADQFPAWASRGDR